ncbi:hypothetical protein V5O48_007053 [Marasmius crinis-equi]|uniref:BTB domain-containing protein n=1 Tax=Marasmius crinis-equi TaxID=585013 RepID=A0ABR3FHQ9_9AGAR
MPALLLDPGHVYEPPTYPPRPTQQRSASVSSSDSGVIITPANSPPARSIVDCSLPASPNRGIRTVSLSSERSGSSAMLPSLDSPNTDGGHAFSPTLVNVVPPIPSLSTASLSVPVTVLRSQPITAPSLFAFPVRDDNTPHLSSKSPSPQRKFFEMFDNPTSTPSSPSSSRGAARSVSRGRSKRPIKRISPPASPADLSTSRMEPSNLEPVFNVPLQESSYTSPIPASCSLLMAPERATPPSPPSPPSVQTPSPDRSLSPLKFHDLPHITLPPPPSVSVIPTLSPNTIFSGLGYRKTLPSPSRVVLSNTSAWNLGIPPAPPSDERCSGSKYYFDDGNVVFQVRDKLYKVHRYFFEQNSLTMTVMISSVLERAAFMGRGTGMVNIANYPVVLHDTDPRDFERLLSIFYPTDYSQHDAQTVEDWTSVLRVSTRFGMTKIRSLALDNLYMTANAVEKIALNNEFKFDDAEIESEWILDGYVELVTRVEPLTFEEGEMIGMRDVIRIHAMKGKLLKDLRKYVDVERVREMVEAHL